jgi:2-C-methyl-D-erythritol 2,4-cyclodiphosphate synthase
MEVVTATYAAWNAGEWGLERFHPQVEWELIGRVALDQTGPTRGRDAFFDYLRRFWAAWKRGARWEIEELLELGDEQVLACGRLHLVGRSSGLDTTVPFFQLWTVRGGLMIPWLRRSRYRAEGGGFVSARAGIGYDCHPFEEGRRLVLGGVEIRGAERGLAGHSDADALAHAVIDALLGAAGLGDIGQHFPDTDERWRDADSIALLGEVAAFLGEHGWTVHHVDATVACEAPKLGPYRDEMRARLSEAVGLAPLEVNIKFTTGEGMGFVGRAEGIAALAVATVDRTD